MAEEEDFSQLSLPDRFAHKNWKARKGGYEAAAKEFKTAQPSDPVLRDFIYDSNLWKGAVSDSNVAAQQEGLNSYNAFLEAAGTEGSRRTRGLTVQGVVEKGLTGRPAAKAAAIESLLLLIELDKADPVIEELLPFLSHKLPKIIAATLSALTTIYHSYGCKVVEPKPVVKLLPKVFGHADKNVRAEAQHLTVELYRWLREAMKPLFWGELKELQQKDLEKLFEPIKAEPAPKQERLLRTQQAAQEEAGANGGAEGVDGEADGDGDDGAEIDLEPEYEAVDVFAKIPKDFGDRLASSKWKDRKEALDDLFTAVNVPAIQTGQFDEIMRGCAKSMKDANIMVVTVAANCVECIAKGLRKDFAKYRSTILGPMLERFKEKKQNVVDALSAACDAVLASSGLGDIETEVLEAMKSKNPQVKELSTKFLIRSLKAIREPPTTEQTKELAEASKKLLTESAATLRDAGAEVIGVLWKIMGDRNMLNHLEGLDDIRKNKIKEFCDASEVRAKWRPKAAPPPPRANTGPAASRKPALGSRRPTAVGGAKKQPAARVASPPSLDDAPLQPRPTSRPTTKTSAGSRLPGSGLKVPSSGLQRPAAGLRAPQAGIASPKRQATQLDEDVAASPQKHGFAAPGRGLAGRPLGKPIATPSSPPQALRQESVASSALSSIERQELSELRAEVELLRSQTSDLRQDKIRLNSSIAELQNQNAQLIEDHTRDVLQIKAKETQLVRARSDAETAEERAGSLFKDTERLKREMSRLGRHHGAGSPPVDQQTAPFGALANGDSGFGAGSRPAYGTSGSFNAPPTRAYGGNSTYASNNTAAVDDNGEGKENIPAVETSPDAFHGVASKLSGLSAVPSHSTAYGQPQSNGSSGWATPTSADGEGHQPSLNRSQSEGVESWRRAAEVTQNLKARIELMKARQNLGRGS